MAVGLSKFPVITTEGKEYRVSITQRYSTILGDFTEVRVYVPRRRRLFLLRFKRVFSTHVLDEEVGDDALDFVLLATRAVLKYEAHLRKLAEEERLRAEFERKLDDAVRVFNEWDGRIATNE